MKDTERAKLEKAAKEFMECNDTFVMDNPLAEADARDFAEFALEQTADLRREIERLEKERDILSFRERRHFLEVKQ